MQLSSMAHHAQVHVKTGTRGITGWARPQYPPVTCQLVSEKERKGRQEEKEREAKTSRMFNNCLYCKIGKDGVNKSNPSVVSPVIKHIA